MGNEANSFTLVAYDDKRGSSIAFFVAQKGVTGLDSDKLTEWIKNNGNGKVILKCDQGPPISDSQERAVRFHDLSNSKTSRKMRHPAGTPMIIQLRFPNKSSGRITSQLRD